MLGPLLLSASRSSRMRRLVTTAPFSRRLVDRFVAGERLAPALAATQQLVDSGLRVTLDHLGEDVTDAPQAAATRNAYRRLLAAIEDRGLAGSAEVSMKLSALGQALPDDGDQIALSNAHAICAAAASIGTTVTIDMEDHTTVDSTLEIVNTLRRDFPWVGAVLQSGLRRTAGDCRDLAHSGSRVRLVKGAYAEPESVAFDNKAAVDLAYVKCLKILMAGKGYPMVGTHDPRLIAITDKLARDQDRDTTSYEYQMLYGIRTSEQQRLRDSGAQVRVYVPYGGDWYGYFMRRLAERPANVAFFLRSIISN